MWPDKNCPEGGFVQGASPLSRPRASFESYEVCNLVISQFLAEYGNECRIVTNALHLQAAVVADLYMELWKIELFFTWIKQNLKFKTFLSTSKNAVLTQIWIALSVSLVLAFLSKIGASMQQILRLFHLNLFNRRDIESLFRLSEIEAPPQLALLEKL